MAARRPAGQDADLFSAQERADALRNAPLAARMRPRTLDDYVGQEHIVGAGRMLRQALERDRVPSLILWGPPGSGKTTLAGLIAASTHSHFEPLSAVTAGVADLRRVVQEAKERKRHTGRRTILFIDEIHRFSKAQQDVILPHVEDGTVTLIGATTENPSFEVIAPLLSRCRVVVLRALSPEQVADLVRRALADRARGLGELGLGIEDAALGALVEGAAGDARIALDTLELAALGVEPGAHRITLDHVREALQHRSPRYDKSSDLHYDTISAFIKSIRASDPDASLYWLARMIAAGEDPLFIARRLVILASEDVGMADSQALQVAVAAQQAVHFIGMPEGLYPLAHATLYLATAPKSSSVGSAYFAALQDVARTLNAPVPLHLRNAVTGLMRSLDYGKGYVRYAQDHTAPMTPEDASLPPPIRFHENLPEGLHGARYYQPGLYGAEARLRPWLEALRNAPPSPPKPQSRENATGQS